MSIVEIKGASWHVDERTILRDITWRVCKGEHWVVLGLNGSGKSSLVNMLCGYVYPSEGEVSVLGHRFGRYDLRELRKEIGLVSASLSDLVYMSESAAEIVLSGAYATIGLYDTPEASLIKRAQKLMQQMGCAELADAPFGTLSQGERQRTMIARALMARPRLLLLDEPCAGLDVMGRELVLDAVERIMRGPSAPTVVFVTHHVEEIGPRFTHCLLLHGGEVHSKGQMGKVITGANLSDFYGRGVSVRLDEDGRPALRLKR